MNQDNASEITLYETADGQTRVDVRLQGETVWLSLNQMAELFGRDKSVISRHISNVFEEGELEESATVAKNATVQMENGREVSRNIEFYNLDVIISVSYRVRSTRGTQFRLWATQRLREYIVKGFTMDDERLKQANNDYFDELLNRIRDIRSSEKLFWKKVLDIYATSVDYDAKNDVSKEFFAAVQNKMHWAAHGHTAAEIIAARADAKQPNMGLTHWSAGAISPRKGDVTVAKNYLTVEELDALNLIVSFYLDFAELQAKSRKSMTMAQWISKLDDFLRLSDRDVLTHAGKMSHSCATTLAEAQYETFRAAELAKPSRAEKDFENALQSVNALPAPKREHTP